MFFENKYKYLSCIKKESSILSLYEKIRVRENPYSGMLYVVFVFGRTAVIINATTGFNIINGKQLEIAAPFQGTPYYLLTEFFFFFGYLLLLAGLIIFTSAQLTTVKNKQGVSIRKSSF